ncbi:MAG: aspartyl protease family protein [Bacteroidaceae bacterium]|nr:aspartyl protease family protein [Bacteroidaceae bacterium]
MSKQTIIAVLFALVAMSGQAQDVSLCQPIAERILTAAQNHQPDGIDELLAPDFRFTRIKQPVAAKVLRQIIAQMPAITGWELAGTAQDSTVLTLRYLMTKPDSTTMEATFLFNADNLVLEADLLRAEISIRHATPTAKAEPGLSMVRIPIHLYGGLPIVSVTIDGRPCNMFFDTGAPGVILNSKYFDHNIDGEVMGSGGRGAVGTGSVSGLHHVNLMDMGGVTLSETDIMTSDLSNLETVGVAVHGILGQSFYKDFDVLFDFKAASKREQSRVHSNSAEQERARTKIKGGEIVLLTPDTTHQWLLGEGYRSQAVRGVMKGHLLAFDCQAGGVPVVLAFDSGAQSNLLAGDWPQRHPSSVKGLKKAHLTGYGDGRASITKGKTTLTLGNRTFKNQRTAFSDVSHLKESKGIDGLFGCEVLARQTLLISYRRQELLLID